MRPLLFGAMGHLIIANLIGMPWVVPNLTLGGLALAIGQAPHRWWAFSAGAGFWMAIWAIRVPIPVVAGYACCGWFLSLVATRWQLSDRRVQCVSVGLVSLLLSLGLCWVEQVWSVALVGWICLHTLLTMGAVLCLQRLVSARRQGRPR